MPGKKQNNDRKHGAANHQPRHKAAERSGKAEARQEHYDSLTIQQKLDRLPPAPQAEKQRKKLLGQLQNPPPKKEKPKKAEKFQAIVDEVKKDGELTTTVLATRIPSTEQLQPVVGTPIKDKRIRNS